LVVFDEKIISTTCAQNAMFTCSSNHNILVYHVVGAGEGGREGRKKKELLV
jgi:hypothetical protein